MKFEIEIGYKNSPNKKKITIEDYQILWDSHFFLDTKKNMETFIIDSIVKGDLDKPDPKMPKITIVKDNKEDSDELYIISENKEETKLLKAKEFLDIYNNSVKFLDSIEILSILDCKDKEDDDFCLFFYNLIGDDLMETLKVYSVVEGL